MPKHVLVVEDEDAVREIIVRTLRDAGYRVEAAVDGAAALTKVKTTSRFDLLIVDQRTPRMTGDDFIRAVRVFRPRQTVMRILGDMDDVRTQPVEGGCPPLPKPFRPDYLVSVEGSASGSRERPRATPSFTELWEGEVSPAGNEVKAA